jgi:HlyD family secretion protein
MTMQRWLTVVVIVLVAVSGSAAYARPSPISVSALPAKSDAGTGCLAEGEGRSAVTATGSIVPNRQSILSFELPGTVAEVWVSEGQHVRAGQPLARLDDTTQQFNLQQANYTVQAAQAALAKLLEPVDSADVSNAEANVKAAEGAYSAKASIVSPDTIKAYQLQYQQALAALQSANKIRADAGGQLKTDDPNYLKYVAQVGIAQDNADIAKYKLEQVQEGASLESVTANIAYAQARLAQVKAGPRPLDIESAQAQLAIATLQRDQAQHLLDKTRLLAPFAGTITQVNIKPGEVSSGAAIALIDDSLLFVDVQVNEVNIGAIQVGQPVEMSLDALPGTTLLGKVRRIDPIATAETPVITYTVRVALDTTDAPIKVGMTANATFVVNPDSGQ